MVVVEELLPPATRNKPGTDRINKTHNPAKSALSYIKNEHGGDVNTISGHAIKRIFKRGKTGHKKTSTMHIL
jgi:hypothetical protein